MSMDKVNKLIRDHITVPPHIDACASAIRYDLMHGPSYARIPAEGVEAFTVDDIATYREDLEDDARDGDTIEQTYCGTVADTLRAFLDDLPSELYVDLDCDHVSESAPEGEWVPAADVCPEDDDGELDTSGYETDNNGNVYVEPYTDETWHIEGRGIVEALFGHTIAREFH